MGVIRIYISDDYFIYDGVDSAEYGLKFAWIGSEPDTAMIAKKAYNYIKHKANNKFKVAKSVYESPFEFKVGLISDKTLTEHEVRQIYHQFFNHNQFKKLEFLRYNGEKIYINSILSNPQRVEGSLGIGDGTVGFEVTVICDAPWGWTEEFEIIPEINYKSIGNGMREAEVVIYNYSDIHEYIYPVVEFETVTGENCSPTASFLTKSNCHACSKRSDCEYAIANGSSLAKAMIVNESDSPNTGVCVIAANGAELGVVMKPETGYITVKYGEANYGIEQTNKKFLRLVPGENILAISNIKEGTLKIKYREARVFV